jgi:LacI family transcriptional regulator
VENNMVQPRFRTRRPTQYDVAERAGVSQATVSQVLNNASAISVPEETRQRILAVVQELGYVPNLSARSLRTQKTYTIAVILPDITNPFYPLFLRGIQDVTEQYDYNLVAYNSDGIPEKEAKCLEGIKRNHVDGLIASLFEGHEDLLSELDLPIVLLGPKPAGPYPYDVIWLDNILASRQIVRHLIRRGYPRMAMLAGIVGTPPHQKRYIGFCQALEEHQIPLDESLVIYGDFTENSGYNAMKILLQRASPPLSVFAVNDLMAMGAMLAIREAGLHIPQDIAIAAFDDIPAAELTNPPLTTINQHQENMGRQAAEMLFEQIMGKAPPEVRIVEMPFDLVIRESA